MARAVERVYLCECGCGDPVGIAKESHFARGYVRNGPLHYLPGHNARNRMPLERQLDRSLARFLRRLGWSYAQIAHELGVSKTAAYRWVHTEEDRQRSREWRQRNPEKMRESNARYRRYRSAPYYRILRELRRSAA